MSGLKFSILSPSKKLRPFVRRILLTEGGESTKEIVPIGPTGFGYLTYSRYPPIIHYSKRKIKTDKQLFMVNQLDNEQPYFEIKGRFFHIGLELLPTTPYYLFGVTGKAITDDFIMMEEHFPEISEPFLRQVDGIENAEIIAKNLEQLIAGQIPFDNHLPYLDKSLEIIYQNGGNVDMTTILNEIDVSERHFRRQFKKIIGISPKQYCKVIQFNAVFEAIQNGQEKKLYDMALKHGYYDHAHFINDFKSVLGQSPQQFLKSEHKFLKSYLGAVIS